MQVYVAEEIDPATQTITDSHLMTNEEVGKYLENLHDPKDNSNRILSENNNQKRFFWNKAVIPMRQQ